MKKLLPFLFLLATPAYAQGAPPVVFTINIVSPSSTSASCAAPSPLPAGWTVTGNTYSLMAPVAAGTVLCTMSVQPASWQGGFTVTQNSGPQASAFTMSGMNFQVGSAALATLGAYSVTVSLTP